MGALFVWLQQTAMAGAVDASPLLTGALSAVHLLGFTLATGGAFVSNLRLLGILLRERPLLDVFRPASRGVAIGLVISIATGFLLFAPRAVAASANTTFQIKMLLLATGAIFHFGVQRGISRRPVVSPVLVRTSGAIGFLIWTGLALAGCAFILLE